MGPNSVILLENNFTASAAGCSIPTTPTLLGPTRACIKDSTLRSIKVTKATFTNTQTTLNKISSR